MLYPDFDELVALKSHASQLSLASNRAVTSTSVGDHSSPFRGQGLEFEEVREYAAGDDIRSIDWRVTARTGSPHTKVFKEERERSVIICVDANAVMRFGTRDTFKSVQAARVAALLGWQANSNRDRLGACIFGDVPEGMQFFAPKRSRTSLWAMLKQLSDQNIVSQSQPIMLENTLQHINKAAPTGALIYIISDFGLVSDGLEQQLANLQKRCNVILITIDDPADHAIPPVGALLCSKNIREKCYVNTDSKSGRENYTKIWQENRRKLERIAGKIGIHTLCIATDSEIQKELSLGLKRISKRRRAA